ncbi:MAG: aminotransferase class V-fold PLP-dependent enzyme [Treponemataceae bacterium]
MPNLNQIGEQLRKHVGDRDLFELAKNRALDYMESVNQRKVFPSAEAVAGLAAFQENLPNGPCEPRMIIDLLCEKGSPATAAQTGGRYFGFVNGGILPAALAAKWIADAWDQNAGLYVISPVASVLENVCERWLVDLLHLPEGTAAGFVGGTSTATLCGLAVGRDELLRKAGYDVGARGLFGAPEIKVILGAQAHSTVYKALSILGLGRERVISVPVDDEGRIRPESVPELDDRSLLILQAGNVSTGSFDPFKTLCEKARKAGSWVHVDGAFGLWAAASDTRRKLVYGVDGADSWSADAHKTLNAPYDNGVIFCRDREALIRSMRMSGSYIAYSENRDGMIYTPDMSRRARSVELWATLKALGRSGVGALVDQLCDNALRFADGLRAAGFIVLNDVVFNQVLISCGSSELTRATLKGVQDSGEAWCGGATWNNEAAIRISVCSYMTTSTDVDRSIRAFVEARKGANK